MDTSNSVAEADRLVEAVRAGLPYDGPHQALYFRLVAVADVATRDLLPDWCCSRVFR